MDFRDVIENKIRDLQADFAIYYSIPQMRNKNTYIILKTKLETLLELLNEMDRLESDPI